MDNILTTWLTSHEKAEKLTSSEVSYDRFVYDDSYSKMYVCNEHGIFRELVPRLPEDWSKKVFINLFQSDVKCRYSHKPIILDMGSGTGFPSFFLKDIASKIYSVDYSKELQNIAKKNCQYFNASNIEVINAIGENLPFDDNSIDCVVMSHYLEFSFNPEKSLAEISRVLKPEGFLIGLTSNWSQAVNQKFVYLNKEKVLYPMLKADVRNINGERLLKYRVCTLNPHYEKTFFIKMQCCKHLDVLIEIIMKGRLNLAIQALSKMQIVYIQYAFCKQFDENTLKDAIEQHGFVLKAFHGVRIPIQRFIESLQSDNDFDFSNFSQSFDLLSKHMVEIVRSTSPVAGFDMYYVAQNKKGSCL